MCRRLRHACRCSSHGLPYVRPSDPQVGRSTTGQSGQRHCEWPVNSSTWQYSPYDHRHCTPPHVALPSRNISVNVDKVPLTWLIERGNSRLRTRCAICKVNQRGVAWRIRWKFVTTCCTYADIPIAARDMSHYVKTWRHPQNWEHITSSRKNRATANGNKYRKFSVLEICQRTYTQANRQTYTMITILHNPTGDEVKKLHSHTTFKMVRVTLCSD